MIPRKPENEVIAARIREEGPIDFAAAAELVKGHGYSCYCNPGSVFRWAVRGKPRADGKGRVKLETVRINGQRYTSHLAVMRFCSLVFASRS